MLRVTELNGESVFGGVDRSFSATLRFFSCESIPFSFSLSWIGTIDNKRPSLQGVIHLLLHPRTGISNMAYRNIPGSQQSDSLS